MSPEAAVAELLEASGEVRTALLLDEHGELVAHAGDGDPQNLAELSAELLAAAEVARARNGAAPVGRVEVSGPSGGVFAVRRGDDGAGKTLVAVTAGGALPSLVIYDLRMTLARTEVG